MLQEIHKKIEEYYNRYKEMPNTVLLPSDIYEALKNYSKNMYLSHYNDVEDKVFGLNIITVYNKEEIKVTKIEL